MNSAPAASLHRMRKKPHIKNAILSMPEEGITGGKAGKAAQANMERELYAVCPGCGNRAKIISYCWNWDQDQAFAKIRCVCGIREVPFEEERVVDIDLNNPYMQEAHFRLLIPANMPEKTWNMIGGMMMSSWAFDGTK